MGGLFCSHPDYNAREFFFSILLLTIRDYDINTIGVRKDNIILLKKIE
jgi:hypothetical protein